MPKRIGSKFESCALVRERQQSLSPATRHTEHQAPSPLTPRAKIPQQGTLSDTYTGIHPTNSFDNHVGDQEECPACARRCCCGFGRACATPGARPCLHDGAHLSQLLRHHSVRRLVSALRFCFAVVRSGICALLVSTCAVVLLLAAGGTNTRRCLLCRASSKQAPNSLECHCI